MLLYYLFMIVIFQNLAVLVLSSSDESKYIDLLPEDEKEQFLQKIARRIFENVESKESEKKISGEILDKHLDEQDAFVKKIYNEESQNLRRVNKKNEGNKQKAKFVENEDNIKVIGLDKQNERADIDFTLRDGSDHSKDFLMQTEESYTVKVDVRYEEKPTEKSATFESQKDDFVHVTSLHEDNKSEDTVEKDIQVRKIRRIGENVKKLVETVTTEKNLHQYTIIDHFDPEPVEHNENNSNNKDVANPIEEEKVTETKEAIVVTEATNVAETVEATEEAEVTGTTEVTEVNEATDSSTLTEATEPTNVIDKIESDKKTKKIDFGVPESCENNTKIENPDEESISDKIIDDSIEVNRTTNTDNGSTGRKHLNSEEEDINKRNIKNDVILTKIKVNVEDMNAENSTLTAVVITSDNNNNAEKEDIKDNSKDDNPETKDKLKDKKDDVLQHKLSNTKVNLNDHKESKIKEKDNLDFERKVDLIKDLKVENVDVHNVNIVTTENILRSLTPTPIKIEFQKNSKSNDDVKKQKRFKISSNKENKISSNKEDKISAKKEDKEVFSPYYLLNALKYVLMKSHDNLVEADKDYKNKIISTYDKLPYESIKDKEYNVYEIVKGQSPFLRQKRNVTNQEEPYYVPVYNYAPDNAYYNPKNRLGPSSSENARADNIKSLETEIDNISEQLDADLGIFGAGNRKSRYDIPDYMPAREFKKIHRPHFIEQSVINPEDYHDMNYYTGRIGSNTNGETINESKESKNIFPDSSEAEYTNSNDAAGGLKSNLHKIRKILYVHKIFGHVPPKVYTTSKPVETSVEIVESDEQTAMKLHQPCKSKKCIERTEVEKPVLVKRYKNIGYVNSNKGKKKLYLPFDEITQHEIKLFQLDDKLYKSRGIARLKDDDFYSEYRNKFYSKLKDTSTVNSKICNINKEGNDYCSYDNKKDINQPKNNFAQNIIDSVINTMREANNNMSKYIEVMEDMIETNDNALVQYDWLGSTVDIQAALDKLFDLTKAFHNGDKIHASDVQLYKYVLSLYNNSKNDSKVTVKYEIQRSVLPRNNKRVKHTLLKKRGLLERAWLYKRTLQNIEDLYNKLKNKHILNDYELFLIRLEGALFDLHTTISHIAQITKYKKQHWFENIKDLYLKGKKEYLEVILHLATSRLISLIEESAQNGLEDDYKEYIKNNQEEYNNTKREFVFVLNILAEINSRS